MARVVYMRYRWYALIARSVGLWLLRWADAHVVTSATPFTP